ERRPESAPGPPRHIAEPDALVMRARPRFDAVLAPTDQVPWRPQAAPDPRARADEQDLRPRDAGTRRAMRGTRRLPEPDRLRRSRRESRPRAPLAKLRDQVRSTRVNAEFAGLGGR